MAKRALASFTTALPDGTEATIAMGQVVDDDHPAVAGREALFAGVADGALPAAPVLAFGPDNDRLNIVEGSPEIPDFGDREPGTPDRPQRHALEPRPVRPAPGLYPPNTIKDTDGMGLDVPSLPLEPAPAPDFEPVPFDATAEPTDPAPVPIKVGEEGIDVGPIHEFADTGEPAPGDAEPDPEWLTELKEQQQAYDTQARAEQQPEPAGTIDPAGPTGVDEGEGTAGEAEVDTSARASITQPGDAPGDEVDPSRDEVPDQQPSPVPTEAPAKKTTSRSRRRATTTEK